MFKKKKNNNVEIVKKSVDKQSFVVIRLACTFEELKKSPPLQRSFKTSLMRYFTIFELFLCLEETKILQATLELNLSKPILVR